MKNVLILAVFLFTISNVYSQQSKAKKAKTTSSSQSVADGKNVYMTYCVSCHQTDGGGMPNMNPPLIKTSFVLGDKVALVQVLLKGMSHQEVEGESYHNVMPPFDYLSDKDIADVLTFVRNNFGNKAKAVTVDDVQQARTLTK